MYRSIQKYSTVILGTAILAACGGGGGGDGGDYGGGGGGGGYGNNPPTITNSTSVYSAQENQTAAFTVTASDSDGDTLTYSIASGTDANMFDIDTSGNVTFSAPPDFENPGDSNADNVYLLTAAVSDGTASDTMAFEVNVTNDPSDDPISNSYDGVVVGPGYIQGATVCTYTIAQDCEGAEYSTTTNSDGSFTLTSDEEDPGLFSVGGFDPITGVQWDEFKFKLNMPYPVTEQNLVISPLSTLLTTCNTWTYNDLKDALGIDSSFMLRFDDPFGNLSDPIYNKPAVINTQLSILEKILSNVSSGGNNTYSRFSNITCALENRVGDETSLSDTTFIRDVLLNYIGGFNNDDLENLSAVISSFLQKVYADSSNAHSYFYEVSANNLISVIQDIQNGNTDQALVDQIIFDTLTWISSNSDFTGVFDDIESTLRTTTYTVGNSGSAYYTVDGVNADSTPLVIYARVGDTIVFEPTANSVFSAHPFEISTTANDTSGSNNIGSSEGWDQSSHTLTVTDSTPTTLYPHCGVHTGMYTNGRIEIVTTFDQSLIDITSASSGLEVSGTVSVGPFKGASGNTHTVYLRAADAGSDYHEHQFHELPGLTFYMPADQGYHGATNSSGQTKFKTKSHY